MIKQIKDAYGADNNLQLRQLKMLHRLVVIALFDHITLATTKSMTVFIYDTDSF